MIKNIHSDAVRSILRWNSLAVLLVIALILYGIFAGLPPSAIVAPPPSSQSLYNGFLTHAMQVLCAVPVITCAFSYALLNTLRPHTKANSFLLASALVTGGFLANEILRIHVILSIVAGIPKVATILIYSVALVLYVITFRRQLCFTPYGLLIVTIASFAFAFAMDSQLLGHQSPLAEGIPKFFSFLNLALFFWLVCRKEMLQVMSNLR